MLFRSIVIPRLNKNSKPIKSKELLKKENFLKNTISPEYWEIIADAMYKVVNQKNGTAWSGIMFHKMCNTVHCLPVHPLDTVCFLTSQRRVRAIR